MAKAAQQQLVQSIDREEEIKSSQYQAAKKMAMEDDEIFDTRYKGDLWVFSGSQINERGKVFNTYQVQRFSHPSFRDHGVQKL